MRINLFVNSGQLIVQLLDGYLVISESSIYIKDIIAALPNNTMPTDDDYYIHATQRPGQQIETREQNEARLLAELKNKPT